MHTVPLLILPEAWRRTTLVFLPHKVPRGVIAPMVSHETYDDDRKKHPDVPPPDTSRKTGSN